ncbi:uncharacterized protein G2W53_009514 [Senna tora]|uniref:Uncharacterized protein n=1 Tax=Senna tora TaxID=362788 RepID=A0A834WYE9_9FABA|nr:uncharacterized protein G2W53_009514 [Senna tora]
MITYSSLHAPRVLQDLWDGRLTGFGMGDFHIGYPIEKVSITWSDGASFLKQKYTYRVIPMWIHKEDWRSIFPLNWSEPNLYPLPSEAQLGEYEQRALSEPRRDPPSTLDSHHGGHQTSQCCDEAH